MKKRTVFALILISLLLSACVYWKNAKRIPAEPIENEMSLSDQAFYEIIGNRSVRDVPPDAGFGAYLAGSFAKTQRDFKTSARYFSQALAQDPSSPDLLNSTYLMYVLDGDVPAAVPFAIKEIDREPANVLPRLVLFTQNVKEGRFEEARSLLGSEVKGQEAAYGLYLTSLLDAWTYVGQDNLKKALDVLEKANTPGLEALYYLHKGLILDYFGENQKAMAAYDKLFQVEDGQSLRALMTMYDFYRRKNLLHSRPEFEKAYETMRNSSFVSKELMTNPKEAYRATSVQKGISMVFFDMAGLVSQLDSYETALFLAQLARYLDLNASINTLFTGEILDALHKLDTAADMYQSVSDQQDLYLSMQLRYATNLFKMGKTKESYAALNKLIKNHPKIPIFYMTLGDYYRENEQCVEANKAYDQALSVFGDHLNSEVGILYFSKAVCFEQMGQLEQTEKDLKKAVALDPENPIYQNYLGYTWVEMDKNIPEAYQLITKAVAAAPEDGNVLDSLGWVYYTMGQYEKALPIIEKAVSKEAGNAAINDHLGDIYWRLGRTREARFQWNHALILKESSSEKLRTSLRTKIEKGLPPVQQISQN